MGGGEWVGGVVFMGSGWVVWEVGSGWVVWCPWEVGSGWCGVHGRWGVGGWCGVHGRWGVCMVLGGEWEVVRWVVSYVWDACGEVGGGVVWDVVR